jgi:hypothetical protein
MSKEEFRKEALGQGRAIAALPRSLKIEYYFLGVRL